MDTIFLVMVPWQHFKSSYNRKACLEARSVSKQRHFNTRSYHFKSLTLRKTQFPRFSNFYVTLNVSNTINNVLGSEGFRNTFRNLSQIGWKTLSCSRIWTKKTVPSKRGSDWTHGTKLVKIMQGKFKALPSLSTSLKLLITERQLITRDASGNSKNTDLLQVW